MNYALVFILFLLSRQSALHIQLLGEIMEHFGFEYWLFTFCIYCILGWLQESAIESLYHKRPINRGFLKGPYIPIYGVGGLLLLFICAPFKDNGFAVFFVAMISCTALEYFTGWLMETMFGRQFWDYSMMKFTYKNRISLLSSLFWGVMGLFVTYVVADATVYLLSNIPHQMICVIAVIIPLFMTIDFVNTVRKMTNRKNISKVFSISNVSAHLNIIGKLRSRFSGSEDLSADEFDDKDDDTDE